jgi:hypothetical protein
MLVEIFAGSLRSSLRLRQVLSPAIPSRVRVSPVGRDWLLLALVPGRFMLQLSAAASIRRAGVAG